MYKLVAVFVQMLASHSAENVMGVMTQSQTQAPLVQTQLTVSIGIVLAQLQQKFPFRLTNSHTPTAT